MLNLKAPNLTGPHDQTPRKAPVIKGKSNKWDIVI